VLQEAEYNYITGRHFLARNNPDQALIHLRRAVEQVPGKADYHFWLGVAYWAGQDPQNEETSYQRALQLDPEFVPAHLYLGHHYLEQGDWQGALDRYHRVLARAPNQKEALFNAALALQHLGRGREENRMWTAYLQHNPSGTQALQALNHLMANGDLGFQPVTLGDRVRVAPRIGFEKGPVQLTPASLAVLSEIGRDLSVTDDYILHIVVYVQNDRALAEQRAKTIKKQILGLNPGLSSQRVRVSWFDMGSVIQVKDQTLTLPADVRIFTQKQSNHPKEEIL
jgi:tetratricopeptide (TPR) repeat protein